jgi:mRNA interferase MazF
MVSMPKGVLSYQRGEIRWVKLDPTLGAEIQKTRSCLILQNDTMNQYGQLTIAIPFRPGVKRAPYAVNVAASTTNGLDQDRFLDVAQIRSIDQYSGHFFNDDSIVRVSDSRIHKSATA